MGGEGKSGEVELLHNFVSMNSLFSLIPRPKIL